MDQLSFASLAFAAKKKRTKRDVFLAEMAAVVPWAALEAVIEPHYPKAGPNGGWRPFPLTVMLRIYCLQQWYLSDPGAEEAFYDFCSMRAFAGSELGRDAVPDSPAAGVGKLCRPIHRRQSMLCRKVNNWSPMRSIRQTRSTKTSGLDASSTRTTSISPSN
jgi:hypothetical protein